MTKFVPKHNNTLEKIERWAHKMNTVRETVNDVWIIKSRAWKKASGDLFYPVYTKEQAQDRGITYYPYPEWYKANALEFIETVDGWVIPIVRRNDNPNYPYLRTVFGSYALTKQGIKYHTDHKQVNTVIRAKRTTIGGNSVAQDNRLTPKQRDMATYCAANMLTYGSMREYKTAELIYSREMTKVEVDRLVYSQKFQRAVVQSLANQLNNAGLTTEFIFGKLKAFIDNESLDERFRWEIIQEVMFQQGLTVSKMVDKIKVVDMRRSGDALPPGEARAQLALAEISGNGRDEEVEITESLQE